MEFRFPNNMTRTTSRLLLFRRSERSNRNAEVQDTFRTDSGGTGEEDCRRERSPQERWKQRRGQNNRKQQVEAASFAFAEEKRKEGLTMQPSKETKTDEDIRYAEWREPYQQALLEFDQKKLRERIAVAETSISNRLRAIAGSSNHHVERQAIDDALSSLRALKRNSR
jgi:hypothetical protein